jgi:deoxyribodipyrimidine photolyase-related protein
MSESVWILGDQLLEQHPGLANGRRVVLVESLARLRQQRYHIRKLGLIVAAMRHYAAALNAHGYTVDLRHDNDFLSALRAHIAEHRVTRLFCMAAAEYATRSFQQELAALLAIDVVILPNTQFLLGRFPPTRSPKLMEPFYREMRKRTGLLITSDGQPEGGSWNYDADNRKRYDGRPIPPPPTFSPDALTRTALADVQAACPDARGTLDGFDLAVTRRQALTALAAFIAERLPAFGPFEDAMSAEHGVLFHSLLSPLLNIGLLEPMELCEAAVAAYHDGQAALPSVEGFVRQIIGWREYMYLRYWELMPGLHEANAWQHERPLPQAYWSAETKMRCLQHAVERVLAHGYSHHIERLMVLCNFALLAGIKPQEVNAWFHEYYIDAYDWVVTPNVIGMGLNADGRGIATKPYIASAAYINKMSDYCGSCHYDHKRRHGEGACPFNTLYWNFLITHEPQLRANPRLGPAVLGLRHLDESERAAVQTHATALLADLDTV